MTIIKLADWVTLVGDDRPALPAPKRNPNWVRQKYIIDTVDECGGNISEACRRLQMHRRTVQRILQKRQPVTRMLEAA